MNQCICGHEHNQHNANGTCRACLKCAVPGYQSHIPDRCDCPGYEPEVDPNSNDVYDSTRGGSVYSGECTLCGKPVIHGEICGQCQRATTRKV